MLLLMVQDGPVETGRVRLDDKLILKIDDSIHKDRDVYIHVISEVLIKEYKKKLIAGLPGVFLPGMIIVYEL